MRADLIREVFLNKHHLNIYHLQDTVNRGRQAGDNQPIRLSVSHAAHFNQDFQYLKWEIAMTSDLYAITACQTRGHLIPDSLSQVKVSTLPVDGIHRQITISRNYMFQSLTFMSPEFNHNIRAIMQLIVLGGNYA